MKRLKKALVVALAVFMFVSLMPQMALKTYAANCTPPTAKTGLAYNGDEQVLIDAGSISGNNRRYMYRLDEGVLYVYHESVDDIAMKDAGTYTVQYKSQTYGKKNSYDIMKYWYDDGESTGSFQVTISPASTTIEVDSTSFQETGSEVGPTITSSTVSEYTINGTNRATTVGDYSFSIIPKSSNYAESNTINWSVTARPIFSADTMTVENGGTYTGNQKNPAVTVKNNEGASLTLNVDYTLSGDLNATDAGTYSITATGIGSYAGCSATKEWKIEKADPVVKITPFDNLEYNGSEQKLLDAANTSTSGGTLKFKSSGSLEYSTAIPDKTFPSTYTIDWKVEGGKNYNDKSGSLKVTISKAEIDYVKLSDTEFAYDGKEHSVTVKEVKANGVTVPLYNTSGTLTATEKNTYTVTVSALDSAIYFKGSEEATWTIADKRYFNDGKLEIQGSDDSWSSSSASYVYTGTAIDVSGKLKVKNDKGDVLTAGADYTVKSSSVTSATDVGTYTVVVEGKAGTEYAGCSATATWKITKATPTVTVVPVENLEYNTAEQDLIDATKTSTTWGTILYRSTGSALYSDAIPDKTLPTTYTVDYMVIGDKNHETVTGSVEVTIAKASIDTVYLVEDEFPYNKKERTVTVSSVVANGITINNVDFYCDVTGDITKTEVGDYKVTVSAKTSGLSEYLFTGSADATWSIVDKGYFEDGMLEIAGEDAQWHSTGASWVYSGSEITPSIQVKNDKGNSLTEGDDYEIVTGSGVSATDAGTYTITVKGKGIYDGCEATASWEIKKADIIVHIEPKTDLEYNGISQKVIDETKTTTSWGTIKYSELGVIYTQLTPDRILPGTQTYYWKVEGDKNHNDAHGDFTVTMEKAEIDKVTLAKDDFEYDGKDHYAVVTYVEANGVPVTVASCSVEGTTTAWKSGTYKLKVVADKDSALFKGEKEVSWTITGSSFFKDGFLTIKDEAGVYSVRDAAYVYTGKDITPKIKVVNELGMELEENTHFTVTATSDKTKKNAGNYTIKIEGKGAYAGCEATAYWKINKIVPEVTVTGVEGLVYDVTDQKLIDEENTSTDFGTIEYSVRSQQSALLPWSSWSEWSSEIPEGNLGGTYLIHWRVVGDNNHASMDAYVTVVIAPEKLSKHYVSLQCEDPIVYDGKLHDVEEAYYVAIDGNKVPYPLNDFIRYIPGEKKAVNAGDYYIYMTQGHSWVFDFDEALMEIQKKWTILKADITDVSVTAAAQDYTGSPLTPVVEKSAKTCDNTKVFFMYGTEEGKYDWTLPSFTDAGTYTIYYKAIGTTNFNAYEGSFEFTINQIEIPEDAQVSLGKALHYTGSELEQDVASVKFTKGGVNYDLKLGTDYLLTDNKGTDAKAYKLTITGTKNFTGSIKRSWVIIDQKKDVDDLGDIKISVKNDPSAPTVSMNCDKADLVKDVATADELAAIADGATLDIWLEITDISGSISPQSKQAILEAAGDRTILSFIDISLFKKLSTAAAKTQITDLTKPITITIQLTDDMINGDPTVERTYSIVQNHGDGNVNVIDGVYDPATKTVSFAADKFSDYALIYQDRQVGKPKTGDSNNIWIYVLVGVGALAAGTWYTLSLRKKED